MNAKNPRRPLEGTEHEDDAAIVPQMRDGLDAAAGEIEIGNGQWIDDVQRVEPLGRAVHMPTVARSCGCEEEMLALDPGDQIRSDGFVDATHDGPILCELTLRWPRPQSPRCDLLPAPGTVIQHDRGDNASNDEPGSRLWCD